MIDGKAFDSRVRHVIYDLFVQMARAPSAAEVAAHLGETQIDVAAAFRRLADSHTLVLRPGTTEILMAHPLSAIPTGYETHVNGRTYWPNCGWDALGVAAMMDGPARVTFHCPDCDDPIEFSIVDGKLDAESLRVHFAVPARHWWDDIEFT